MSVPQMPTRWTRTSASPGPGWRGPSISTRLNCLGASRDRAFMGGLQGRLRLCVVPSRKRPSSLWVVILRAPLDVEPVVDRPQDFQDLAEELRVGLLFRPFDPLLDV